MQFNAKLKLLATDEKVSKASGTKYLIALFMQGVDTLQLIVNDTVAPDTISNCINKDCNVTMDYNANYKSLRLTNISCLK